MKSLKITAVKLLIPPIFLDGFSAHTRKDFKGIRTMANSSILRHAFTFSVTPYISNFIMFTLN